MAALRGACETTPAVNPWIRQIVRSGDTRRLPLIVLHKRKHLFFHVVSLRTRLQDAPLLLATRLPSVNVLERGLSEVLR